MGTSTLVLQGSGMEAWCYSPVMGCTTWLPTQVGFPQTRGQWAGSHQPHALGCVVSKRIWDLLPPFRWVPGAPHLASSVDTL